MELPMPINHSSPIRFFLPMTSEALFDKGNRKRFFFADSISGELGLEINHMSSFRQIHLKIDVIKIAGVISESKEAYMLEVNAETQKITITGQSRVGVYYGIQSLLSLSQPEGMVPNVIINDSPRFEYRGMELDVGRNFMPKNEVKKLIDTMAMYKLNKFHFHLTDDEGWRLEIPGLPELTEVRTRRKFSFLSSLIVRKKRFQLFPPAPNLLES